MSNRDCDDAAIERQVGDAGEVPFGATKFGNTYQGTGGDWQRIE